MLIVELDVFEIFLESSDFLTNDQFLEVDETMFNFKLLFLLLANLFLKVFTLVPGRWILENDFA